ncbi:hypothetical protein GCM10010168_52880 [Actinoplanes ianthinogenes]|uniref:DUF397 domain-containing protein n=1 Tax=Actinoplanes ianthinogenes TaxID=122358 RepID=A0ABN6C8J4_9ACTN|nr:DUF397 domain-containing protein [Actinoplanes ianthinogenes]BCJ41714.1 hypothetical protein Aiant_23710 [Actinoplanes ianthinogenes]GGR28232.1 hypothetical protein GCM10010168_52880 [Actinoplanes ianthinogenes]
MTEKTYGRTFDRNAVTWRKGSRSNGGGGNCVEVTDLPDGGFAVRDSKDPEGPILFFTPAERAAFVAGVMEENLL